MKLTRVQNSKRKLIFKTVSISSEYSKEYRKKYKIEFLMQVLRKYLSLTSRLQQCSRDNKIFIMYMAKIVNGDKHLWHFQAVKPRN